ncbi:hypothetical protein [Maridesulfovibrio sp.]|uniref:hypothetical protein n=1 Tax=Maridesulfovibrio sp. TaxID=2795000 RepID=UPI002AA7C9B4|nr:hypothetical protein [Maridesulfovibrio sp.]
MINSIGAGYGNHQIDQTPNNTYTAKQQQQTRAQDTVTLSGAGKLMSSFFSGLGIDFTPGKKISLNELEKGAQQQQQKLDDDIKSMFLKNGIDVPPEVQLTSDENGHVRVEGDHPQLDQIEKLFSDNPDIENEFRKVSGMSSLVTAGHEYVEFANQYEKNPYAAVAQYGDQLFGKDFANSFIMTIGSSVPPSRQTEGKVVQEQTANAGTIQSEKTEPYAENSAAIDFTNTTRQGLFNWMNDEIRAGRMSLDESSPFMAMTLKVSVKTGQSVGLEHDETPVDFIEKAQSGLEAATQRNDLATAQQLRSALDIMETYSRPISYDKSAVNLY